MNICRECKSWIYRDDDIPGPYDHACSNGKLNGDYNAVYTPDSIASYEVIAMGPEFGCIHWEAR